MRSLQEDVIFTPFNIGSMRLKNRIVRSACSERGAKPNGEVTEKIINLYKGLSKGGVSLAITGYAYIHPSGKCNGRQLGIDKDSLIEGLKRICDAFHKASSGGKIALQIVHGGRQVKPYIATDVVAPSPVPLGGVVPRPLEEEEIWSIIKLFGDAAYRAKIAGFDAVQIHAAHGYLVSSFISPYTNRRNDKWGGSIENRSRFFVEIVKEIRRRVGSEFPVFAKVNGEDYVEGGLTLEDSIESVRLAAEVGLDGVEVSGGIADTPPNLGAVRQGISTRSDEAYFLSSAEAFKKALKIPVITVGGIRSTQVARGILIRRQADAVSLCRPFIREWDIPRKWREGETRVKCVSCNGCLIDTGDMVKCVFEEMT